MRKYSEYKDSGVSRLPQIPKHWKMVEIKRVAKFNPKNETKLSDDEWVGYAPMERVRFDNMTPSQIQISKLTSGLSYFGEGDIVMAKVTPCFENGNVAIAPAMPNHCGYGSSELFVYRCTPNIVDRYLMYSFQETSFISAGAATMTGTGGLKRVSSVFAQNARIPLPPLSEQQHIVSFLDKKTSQIDEYIATKEKEIEALKEWKKALIARVVTKGLNKNAKMESCKSLIAEEKPSHWRLLRNKNMFEFHYEAVEDRKDIPLLSLTTEGVILRDTSTGKGKFPKDFEKYNVVYPNSIIFCLFDVDETPRTVGLNHYYGMITNAYDTFKIKDTVLPEFITNYYLAVDDRKALRPYYSGLRKVVQYSRFKQIKVPVPPIEEQQQIVDYINKATTKADKMIVELAYHVEYMKEYKQRLIADVVTGKINVQP